MTFMKRREFVAFSARAIAAAGASTSLAPMTAAARSGSDALDKALAQIRALPGVKTYLIEVGSPGERIWRVAHQPSQRVFIGSAFKSFILAKFMQDIEAGRLSLDTLIRIDDGVRMSGSVVFLELAGQTPARSVLEAMTSHSDNTAADAAIARVGADRVRAFLASAGLTSTVIPDSVRIFVSYLAGAPKGVDVGWEGIQRIERGIFPGDPRPALNDEMSSIGTAEELVSYYQRALRGEFFTAASTLVEFKRIHAQGNLTRVAPSNTIAYAKAGSVDWQGFHALCGPGQMILCSGVPVTFAMTINWNGPDDAVPGITGAFLGATAEALAAVKRMFGE